MFGGKGLIKFNVGVRRLRLTTAVQTLCPGTVLSMVFGRLGTGPDRPVVGWLGGVVTSSDLRTVGGTWSHRPPDGWGTGSHRPPDGWGTGSHRPSYGPWGDVVTPSVLRPDDVTTPPHRPPDGRRDPHPPNRPTADVTPTPPTVLRPT